MAAQILIALDRHDRINALQPYLELLAQPEATVVFLCAVETNLFAWWSEGIIPARDPRTATSIDALSATVLRQRQVQAAEQQIAGLRRFLETRGVLVRVEHYTGRLATEVARLSAQDAETMVLRSSRGKFARWFEAVFVHGRLACDRAAPMQLSLMHR